MTDFTKHKKGVTLVELIAAIAILSMVVIGTVTAVVLAQQAMLGDDLQENASLQAQQIADTLLEEMSGKSFADNADELTRYDPDLLNGAVYVGAGDFPEAKTVGGSAVYDPGAVCIGWDDQCDGYGYYSSGLLQRHGICDNRRVRARNNGRGCLKAWQGGRA